MLGGLFTQQHTFSSGHFFVTVLFVHLYEMQQQSDSLDCVFMNQFSLGWVTLDVVPAAA